MTRWILQRHSGVSALSAPHSIDASAISRRAFSGRSADQINAIVLSGDGQPIALADLFQLSIDNNDHGHDHLLVEGELGNVHGLGAWHDRGTFEINGDAGDYVGSGMSGGRLSIHGNAGDFLSAPLGAQKLGMSGGQIEVNGNVGHYAGHRMRRGMILISGSAGDKLAASMVAGTLCVASDTGDDLAIGMKRGTLLLGNAAGLVRQADLVSGAGPRRFSNPIRFEPSFLALYSDPVFQSVTASLQRLPVFRTRADRTVGGLGEVIFAVTAEIALG